MMPRWQRLMMPLGMVGALCYVSMIFVGQALWKEYDPASTFVSLLTAIGSPNAPLLRALTNLHGLCVMCFTLAAWALARSRAGTLRRRGYALLFVMAALMFAVFALCPLDAAQPSESPRNLTHFCMTVAIIAMAIIAIGMSGEGYRREGGHAPAGGLCIGAAGVIALFGALALIFMEARPQFIGLAQRMMIFSLEGFIFGLSFANTFVKAFR